jgi:hypothetical protein
MSAEERSVPHNSMMVRAKVNGSPCFRANVNGSYGWN